MGPMRDGPPDDDAYERVTNPERFAPILEAADAVVARLESTYLLARTQRGEPAVEGVIRQVEFVPVAGAPLSVGWSDFPGVRVRYGRWHEESYPQCGCDACDEQPDEVIDDLERKVDALVAGRFTEAVVTDSEGTWLTAEFLFGDGCRTSQKYRLGEGHPLRGEPGQVVWPAWPRRTAVATGVAGGR
jgi:hypothetical protein